MNSQMQHLAKGSMNTILVYINHGLLIVIHITKNEQYSHGIHAGLVSKSCPTLYDLMDCSLNIAHQASLFMGFIRQEYWSGLPFASPRGSS